MTDRTTLEALLARVLEGTGPDRELDAEIDLYLLEAGLRAERFSVPFGAPPYTASLDAVLRDLLPEGWTWARYHGGVFECALLDDRRAFFVRGEAATPPRALIAACLKARMEAQGE